MEIMEINQLCIVPLMSCHSCVMDDPLCMFVDSKRDIATANFVMHEVHCRRNIVLCERCDEPVPRSELDSHFEEFHAMVNCDLCGQSLERAALDSHKVCVR